MPNEITLRTPTADEFPRFIAPLSIAFNRRMTDAEIENDRRTIELDRFLGALEGDAVVGCGGVHTFRLTVPGGEIGAAGITAVGVLPTHRRRGILRQMMTWLFAQARDRHEPVAILWASEAAIYQRFGFGPGTLQTFLDAPKDKVRFLRPVESPGRIRIVDLEEAVELFPPIYDMLRPGVPGSLSRTESTWRLELLADTEWSRHENGDKVLAVIETDAGPRGYVIYRQRPSEWDMTGPKGVVTVLEVTALDPDAEQALWQWIFGIDLIGTIRGWRGPGAASTAVDGHRAAPAGDDTDRRDLAADHRPDRRAGGARLSRSGQPGHRRDRRVLSVEPGSVAPSGFRATERRAPRR